MRAMKDDSAPHPTPADVLDYWLADGLEQPWPSTNLSQRWFGGGDELDTDISARFGQLVVLAHRGGLTEWETPLHARLALVIVIDQFSRNVYRGQARAFEGDGRAQRLVLQTLALGEDTHLSCAARVFLYMPLMHAESRPLQDECVTRFEALLHSAPEHLQEKLQGNLKFAQQHRDIIERFGRFPHRNAVMGRESTAEETQFLIDGPRFGQ
jgi:uncharacterized protein (DUF924 family)